MSREIRPSLILGAGSAPVPFFHKKIGASDVYFLSNPAPETKAVKVTFPVRGSPENWDPWTGEITPDFSFTRSTDGIDMQIELAPYGSRLIVFDPNNRHGPRPTSTQAGTNLPAVLLTGSGKKWSLRAGESHLELTELSDWLQLDQLKSYSGKAEYETRFDVDGDWLSKASQVELELGEVHDVAEVVVNGRPGPLLLMRPYRADVTALLRPGKNVLRIKVTNSWTNLLLSQGVSLANAAGPKPEPEPSGLIGPVRLVAAH
jgi:hypothetical protein